MSYQIWSIYEVDGDELKRKNKFSPKAGKGYFLAEHSDRRTCGKTGYMERK
jgi:small subunit ribosomal protein S27Ae